MTEVQVRPATVEDVADVARLERATEGMPRWDESVYRRMIDGEVDGLRRMLLVAVAEGRVVGFAVGTIVIDESEIESVAVDPSFRRGGVGFMLCHALMAWARDRGSRLMTLEVRQGNDAARDLYAKLGFQADGIRREYYMNPVEDAVLFSYRWE